MRRLSVLLNFIVFTAMVAVGAFYWTDVQAETRLQQISPEDMICLQQNIFFEARNQTLEGQVAVAWVTLNRYTSNRYPDTICGVVKQAKRDAAGKIIKNRCQFSWYCDGKSDSIPDNTIAQRAWEDAQLVANVVVIDWARQELSPVQNATMYHADYVQPRWARDYAMVVKIDDHIFYQ